MAADLGCPTGWNLSSSRLHCAGIRALNVPTPTSNDFGPAYYAGRVGSNYLNYEKWQARRAAWLSLLWIMRGIVRRYGTEPVAHLDVGCAYGYFLAHAAPLVQRSVGVDISPHAIARAKARFPTAEFLEASATDLPFPTETFHVVTCFDTLEHVPDVPSAVRELSRVLKPSGTLILRMPYEGFWRRCLGWNDRDPTHVSVLSLPAWTESLKQRGLVVERTIAYPTLRGGNALFIARKL